MIIPNDFTDDILDDEDYQAGWGLDKKEVLFFMDCSEEARDLDR